MANHTPYANGGASLAQKRHIEDDDSVKSERRGSIEGSAKKKRISLSCAQCAKRKQKCNREFPCNHCLSRKVPELCVPYNPQANSTSHGPDPATASRLDRIESVLSVVLRHHGGLRGYSDVRAWMEDVPFKKLFPPGREEHPTKEKYDHSHPWTSTVPAPIKKPGEPSKSWEERVGDGHELFDLERSSNDDGLERLGELDGGMPETMALGSKVSMKLDNHGTPAENLQRLITDCGVSPHKVAELVQELPPKHFADLVIDWFFSKLNYTRYTIDERLFRISYEDLYNRSTAVDPSNVRALPLVFIVLALAVRLAPEEWAGDDQTRRLSSLRMYWSSRRSILIATAVQSESLELILTRLLSAMYLVAVHDRRLTECWSQLGASLRTAQALGLHRDGTKLGLDPFQTEYRRRIWSYLYHADKLYSLVLGRPPSISDAYTDTLPPSNVELSDFNPATIDAVGFPQPRPLDQPTSATYLILRKEFAKTVGKVAHHFQKLDEPVEYSDVEKLDEEISEFQENLPPHFRMYEPDKSLDSTMFWLPVHRFAILTEILVTKIILHRPWLLRRLSSNRYAASRTACFEAAKLDFKIRQEYQREVPDYKLFANTGQFKMFNSAMIAGISAIIDPKGPDGDYMRQILTTYLEQNPWPEVSQKDETTRKEVQIIQTLSRRAAKIYEDSLAPGELAEKETPAALLLALRESGADAKSVHIPTHAVLTKGPKAALVGSAQTIHESPRSSGSQEDDHSQRLLDHWLSTNHSLAVGSINPQATLLDPSAMSAARGIPNPNYGAPNTNPLFGWQGIMQPMNWDDPSLLTGLPAPNGPGLGGSGGMEPAGGNALVGGGMIGGMGPLGLGMPSQAVTGLDGGLPSAGTGMEGEHGDEYWNALIDGILGTTNTTDGTGLSTAR